MQMVQVKYTTLVKEDLWMKETVNDIQFLMGQQAETVKHLESLQLKLKRLRRKRRTSRTRSQRTKSRKLNHVSWKKSVSFSRKDVPSQGGWQRCAKPTAIRFDGGTELDGFGTKKSPNASKTRMQDFQNDICIRERKETTRNGNQRRRMESSKRKQNFHQ